MQMNLSDAKTQLSDLLAAAERGEEAVIARDGRPIAKLVPVTAASGFQLGLLAGKAHPLPDFLEPMDEDDLARWE